MMGEHVRFLRQQPCPALLWFAYGKRQSEPVSFVSRPAFCCSYPPFFQHKLLSRTLRFGDGISTTTNNHQPDRYTTVNVIPTDGSGLRCWPSAGSGSNSITNVNCVLTPPTTGPTSINSSTTMLEMSAASKPLRMLGMRCLSSGLTVLIVVSGDIQWHSMSQWTSAINQAQTNHYNALPAFMPKAPARSSCRCRGCFHDSGFNKSENVNFFT